jgi:hypothetical protein
MGTRPYNSFDSHEFRDEYAGMWGRSLRSLEGYDWEKHPPNYGTYIAIMDVMQDFRTGDLDHDQRLFDALKELITHYAIQAKKNEWAKLRSRLGLAGVL